VTAFPLTRFLDFDFAVAITDSILVFESGILSFPDPQFHSSTVSRRLLRQAD
jgi:hypothetical protein